MSAAAKKTESAPPHPLLATPIPHAYALVQDPSRPGRFFAVHLTDVVAGSLDILELSGRSEPATHGLQRIEGASMRRHKEKRWTR